MCGIVGILSLVPDQPVDARRLLPMRDSLAHRGPDGAGQLVDGPIALGHRRLAIVDEAGGHQPMSVADVSVVFNGEIYNHRAVRKTLIALGHTYTTESDTETILHAYREWDEQCVNHLEGMFAFALWDSRRQRLLVARDRLGIKPLFFVQTERELVFASEIKALREGGFTTTLDRGAVAEFLTTRHPAGTRTFYQQTRRLLPGHVLTWTATSGVGIRRYWNLPAVQQTSSLTFAEATARVRSALSSAVERHLMSDRPVGVLLSGGLDSSALAALAAPQMSTRLKTFSVGFHEVEGDELNYAREVAEALGTDHSDIRVTADQFFSSLPHLVSMQDEPMAFSSGVPLYFVSRLAQSRVKVVLTGEGADELFLGYNRYRVTYWNERLGAVYDAWLPRSLRRAVTASIPQWPARVRRYAQRSWLAVDAGHRARFFDNFSVFTDRRLRELLIVPPSGDADPHGFGLRCYDEAEGGVLEKMASVDLQTYLCELLAKQDRMSMAASIESRVPFLDDELVAEVCALPGSFKLRGWTTKAVLRAAVADLLPARILTRKKMGFPVPLARWFRGDYRGVIDEFVTSERSLSRDLFHPAVVQRLAGEHASGKADHAEQLWLLVNIEIWQRLFLDGDAADTIMRPVRGWRGDNIRENPVDQAWGPVAPQHRWTPANVPDRQGPGPHPSRDAPHHTWAG